MMALAPRVSVGLLTFAPVLAEEPYGHASETIGTVRELYDGTLTPVSVGTELNITQEGLPDMISVEACYLGRQDSRQNLAILVEPDINP